METEEDKSKKDKAQLSMEEEELRGEEDRTQEWESNRVKNRRIQECRDTMGRGLTKSPGRKRQNLGEEEQMSGKKKVKKWKHPVLDSWGEEVTMTMPPPILAIHPTQPTINPSPPQPSPPACSSNTEAELSQSKDDQNSSIRMTGGLDMS